MKFVILGYHKILSDTRLVKDKIALAVGQKQFDRQISILKKLGFQFITLNNLVKFKTKKRKGKYAAITFDDGSKDILIYGKPILDRYKAPGTVFAVTNFVDRESFFPWDQRRCSEGLYTLKEEDRSMSWQELRTLLQAGWEVGSHTLTHPFLSEIPLDDAKNEIYRSKEIIEDNLGTSVYSFCFPARYCNYLISEMVREAGYKCAVISFPYLSLPNGKTLPQNGNFSLARIGIYRSDSIFRYILKISQVYEFKMKMKMIYENKII